jgi:hypothetical protein
VDGELVLDAADAAGVIMKFNGTSQVSVVDGVIKPTTNNDVDLGASGNQFKNVYIAGNLETDALSINGATVSSTAAELNILDDANSTTAELDQRVLTISLADVSTAGQVYVVAPWAGTLTTVYSVLNGAIGTSDATLTVKNNAGNSAGTITIATSSSATGDLDSLAPSTNNTFTAGQKIEIETDGSSSNTVQVDLTLVFTIT